MIRRNDRTVDGSPRRRRGNHPHSYRNTKQKEMKEMKGDFDNHTLIDKD